MMSRVFPHLALGCLLASAPLLPAAEPPLNTLSEAERKDGWKLLFDGQSLKGWRGFKKAEAPAQGWKIKDGVLTCVAGGKGGDLVSEEQFDNFEFAWEWSMPAKSNNGVKYFITEERPSAVGHEYQLIDDSLIKDHAESGTAAFYLVLAPDPEKKRVKPFGDWNQSRILVRGNHVEHWLNGQKVVEYECGDPKILAQVQQTKFKGVEGFGTKIRGHLLLTYHNDECNFRNLKVRELK
jgi:hypothetical protein